MLALAAIGGAVVVSAISIAPAGASCGTRTNWDTLTQ
jgi:hypothetical protein